MSPPDYHYHLLKGSPIPSASPLPAPPHHHLVEGKRVWETLKGKTPHNSLILKPPVTPQYLLDKVHTPSLALEASSLPSPGPSSLHRVSLNSAFPCELHQLKGSRQWSGRGGQELILSLMPSPAGPATRPVGAVSAWLAPESSGHEKHTVLQTGGLEAPLGRPRTVHSNYTSISSSLFPTLQKEKAGFRQERLPH